MVPIYLQILTFSSVICEIFEYLCDSTKSQYWKHFLVCQTERNLVKKARCVCESSNCEKLRKALSRNFAVDFGDFIISMKLSFKICKLWKFHNFNETFPQYCHKLLRFHNFMGPCFKRLSDMYVFGIS